MRTELSRQIDAVLIAVLALSAAAAAFNGASLFDPVSLEGQADDVYFHADFSRVFANMTDPGSNYFRTSVHPLFPLIAYPPAALLRGVAGLDALTAVRATIAAVAGVWVALLFTLLRRIGCRPGDATLFTLLGASSASALFWLTVPETYPFGSVTILLALLFVAAAERRPPSRIGFVAIQVVSMSVTVTNWMTGVLATLVLRPWRDLVRITAAAFVVVFALTAIEATFFHRVRLPFASLRQELTRFTRTPSIEGAGEVVASFVVHPIVMPGIELVPNPYDSSCPGMRVEQAVGEARPLAVLAAVLWLLLLALGVASSVRLGEHRAFFLVVAGTLAGQVVLHLLYGEETFLYTLHWAPLLVLVAATATRTRARGAALLLCAGLTLVAIVNNVDLLYAAAQHYRVHGMRP